MPSQGNRHKLTARDVMSHPALAIGPATSLGQAITLMTRHRVSGLPVVDENRCVIGIVTEGDLLRRVETDTTGDKPGWFSGWFRPGALAADYVRTHGRRVDEIMTSDVVCVQEDTSLDEIVEAMRRHRIKRLPVLRNGRLVGVVSRADLVARLGAVLSAAPVRVEDAAISRAIVAGMEQEPWSPGRLVDVCVKEGVVQLGGCLFDIRARDAVQVLAENTPGVTRVENNIVCIEPQYGMITFDPAADPTARHTGGLPIV